MYIDYWAIFVVGLLGGFSHCYGMCGGFVMAYSMKTNTKTSIGRIKPHLLYNFGRIVTYTIMGGFFGFLGSTTRFAIKDYQSILFIFAGLFMIFIGLDFGGWLRFKWISNFPLIYKYKKFVGSFISSETRKNLFLYGIVLGFIPCGLVYVAGVQAAASGSTIGGMLTLFSFGLGTVPALFVFGLGTNIITVSFRKKVFKIAAIFVILFGLFTVIKGYLKITEKMVMDKQCQHEAKP